MNQLLLFPEKRNFHLVFIGNKPIGAMSLREYCIKSVLINGEGLYQAEITPDWKTKAVYKTFSEAWQDKFAIQNEIIRNETEGLCPYKSSWQKQRRHWKRFLKAFHEGEPLEVFYARK